MRIKSIINEIINDMRGVSLIELSLALIIIGVLVTPMLSSYNAYIAQEKEDVTEGNIRDVRNAVNKFAVERGRYPLPASFAAVSGDVGYGIEGNVAPALCSSGGWFASDGMCITAAPDEVLIGAVPFDSIGLEAKSSIDYWGGRILYAVTLSQTSAGTYVRDAPPNTYTGKIEVRSLDNAVATPPGVMLPVRDTFTNNIEYRDLVLISHGENGSGAYSMNGTPFAPCDMTLSEYEDENCNMDNIFVLDRHPSATPDRPATRSYVTGGTYYDDYSDDMITVILGTWAPVASAVPDAPVWTGGTRIGIGTTNPQVKVHVEGGDATATNKLRADQMCNGVGGDCFDPEMITGTLTAMDCNKKSSSGGAVTELVNSSVSCSAPADSSGNAVNGSPTPYYFDVTHVQHVSCPPGQMMYGIDNSTGAPLCAIP